MTVLGSRLPATAGRHLPWGLHALQVISADRELSRARVAITAAVRQVVANGLTLLGVSAPERM